MVEIDSQGRVVISVESLAKMVECMAANNRKIETTEAPEEGKRVFPTCKRVKASKEGRELEFDSLMMCAKFIGCNYSYLCARYAKNKTVNGWKIVAA